MRTCNYSNCEHEDEYNELGVKYKELGKTCDTLGKKNHALKLENEQLRGKLEESRRALADANHRAMDAYRELLVLRAQLEGVPPSTDRPELRVKYLGPHRVLSTACLEDGDQYLP